ncbi:MAG: hypothetical protein A2087_08375 [Spirochaetes bacterium GWD1_61_31]|nr:MAG: hypothetical protein A2Y37_02420 [Spirochaetes bacterium GWB1_60_80]OHD33478.1 MAG: hypothetical protein A2004_01165 [Spirochaetes bacterium GWC1_61_12]OHD34765.1 MAG: hypothetical protein A2087_08375 [Spirochaetes bacterium GWD1_61_31]OHD45473.1 MAG: hypothetical protein A2Y35_02690 [Spirochaetes bacterium GWE1_60_18]OHD58045.1 MAG: hypothetical protein A2Y32_05265 [Spirochaetes bacterium GWF1_60_12]HAP44610.1 hypothetical protein [Spirochaetaceae bacterium]
MNRIQKMALAKIASLASAIALTIIIIHQSSIYTHSRFVVKETDASLIFFDKYIDRGLRNTILRDHQAATAGFMTEAGFLPTGAASEPVAYFMADQTYGVLRVDDRLVRRRLTDAIGPDFLLLGLVGASAFPNELVVNSLASKDGRYVFLLPGDNWQESLLHAWVHAMAARNLPRAVASKLNPDSHWDYRTVQAWRFADESLTLFVSDLYATAEATGSLETAWREIAAFTLPDYADPATDLRSREKIKMLLTRDYPERSAAHYQAAHGFAMHLLERWGRETMTTLVGRFLDGRYADLDELFDFAGGLDAAMIAWQDSSDMPD